MAINVGSVEVDVVPNTRGILARLQAGLVPPASQVGDEVGRIIARQLAAHIAPAVRDSIQSGGRAARPAAIRAGQQTGRSFGESLKASLRAAMANLPEIRLNANSTPAQREIHQLRAQMQLLSDARIGIDISAADAQAAITRIQERLERLSRRDPNVQVRVDAGAAAGQLAALQAQINRLDGRRALLDVDSSSASVATSRMAILIGTAITLGPALLPILPVAAAGLGAIAAAATAAAVGLAGVGAVAVPAFVSIAGALQAQKAAQDAATNSTLRGAQSSGQGASKALQMAGAQQALAAAHRNAASQVANARDQVEDALRGVERAERDLAQAQADARREQEALTAARKEAAEELQDLNNRLAGAKLSERDAEIALLEATTERDKVLKNTKSSELDRQKAVLAYDQAVQRLKEQRLETGRLAEETDAANKAGVSGSDTVRQAQERIAQSQQTVRDKTEAVADANRAVVKAQEGVARAQAQAADSIASAQRQIASASQQAAGGVDQAAVAQAKYQEELAKLTPSARGTFDAFVRLRSAFGDWSRALQPAVMPIFTRALNGIRRSLPGLTPFVLAAAKAIGVLQDRVSAGFKSPWWRQFRDELSGSVFQSIIGLGVGFGRIFKGMAGIIDAFLPHMDSISARMQNITGRFADWGTGLKGSPEFERFLAYSSDMGPIVASALRDILGGLLDLGQSLAPVSGPLLLVLGGIFSAIGSIAETLPWLIQLLYLVYVGTKLWTVALWAWSAVSGVVAAATALQTAGWAALNATMRANIIIAIITVIVALVAALIYAYKRVGWFRTAVQAMWDAIKTAGLFAWNKVLKPAFAALTVAVFAVGKAAMWLWDNAIGPAFRAISTAAQWLWRTVLKPVFGFIVAALKVLFVIWAIVVFGPIVIAIKLLAVVFTWLWKTVLGPAIRGIGAAFTWLWNNAIKPAFGFIAAGARLWWNGLKAIFNLLRTYILGPLGTAFTWLWRNAVKPAFEGIAAVAKLVWKNGIKPQFDLLKKGIGTVGDAFSLAVKAIGKAWGKIEDVTRKPVQFVIDTVYNEGIRKVWNTIAKFVGLKELGKVTFGGGKKSSGTTLPGPGKPQVFATGGYTGPGGKYTPAGIVHAGEFVTRKESTARLQRTHPGALDYINRTGMLPGYDSGGVVGDIFGAISGAAKKVGGAVMSGLDFISNPAKMWDRATGFIRDKIKGLTESQWAKAVAKVPAKILTSLKDKIVDQAKGLFGIGGGGASGPVGAAMAFAKAQAGKPYLWGGVGPAGFDCSGLQSSIQRVIMGLSPFARMWATMSFSGNTAPAGWKKNLPAPFRVGITNAGVGHTAGTLAGMNVESRGGQGVVVGKSARGYNDRLFTDWYGFAPSMTLHDSGGWIPPGGFGFNGLSTPEAVLTPRQLAALEGAAQAGIGRGGDGASVSYTINARTADFTVADLQRVQRVQEARQRAGRRR